MFFVGKKKVSFVVRSLPSPSLEIVNVDDDLLVDADEILALREAYSANYKFLVGPFKTLRGARYMINHNSPGLTVSEAERLAKEAEKSYLYGR
jgi:hypothetical protein